MSNSFRCPYCNQFFPLTHDTYCERKPSFNDNFSYQHKFPHSTGDLYYSSELTIAFYKCPNCDNFSIEVTGIGEKVKSIRSTFIKPTSLAKQFPEYVPEPIRNDYEEAYAIVNLSPNSSATLARRCLQGMIHDFWGIHEKNLNAEITSLQSKVSPELWKVLDGVRKIGNIGAHMEHDINLVLDIDPDEAVKLIKLIEFLIKEWYITRHEREKLFSDIIEISDTKDQQRKSSK